jgi:hypothetical protein
MILPSGNRPAISANLVSWRGESDCLYLKLSCNYVLGMYSVRCLVSGRCEARYSSTSNRWFGEANEIFHGQARSEMSEPHTLRAAGALIVRDVGRETVRENIDLNGLMARRCCAGAIALARAGWL